MHPSILFSGLLVLTASFTVEAAYCSTCNPGASCDTSDYAITFGKYGNGLYVATNTPQCQPGTEASAAALTVAVQAFGNSTFTGNSYCAVDVIRLLDSNGDQVVGTDQSQYQLGSPDASNYFNRCVHIEQPSVQVLRTTTLFVHLSDINPNIANRRSCGQGLTIYYQVNYLCVATRTQQQRQCTTENDFHKQ